MSETIVKLIPSDSGIIQKKIPPHLLPALAKAFRAHYEWILSQEDGNEKSDSVPASQYKRARR